MLKIKFSHQYPKMLDMEENMPKKATLIEVFKVNTKDLHPRFVEYDTRYFDGKVWTYYKLPEGEVLVLLFKSILYNNVLWTTIRRYTPQKHKYYLENRGRDFEIILTKEE